MPRPLNFALRTAQYLKYSIPILVVCVGMIQSSPRIPIHYLSCCVSAGSTFSPGKPRNGSWMHVLHGAHDLKSPYKHGVNEIRRNKTERSR